MSTLALKKAKAIYRAAINVRAQDGEGDNWWEAVRVEVGQVLSARTIADAAEVIAWWHHDWTFVIDTPRDAAKRIRLAARAGVHLQASA
ncbi:hypothetical protein [Roseateles sp. P5_E1]